MAVQFAQISDYYNFIGEVMPDDLSDADVLALNSKLLRASRAVARDVRTAHIVWDRDTGFPLSPLVAGGLRDAACAYASWFEDNGDDMSGAGATFNDVAMGSVRLARNSTAAGATSAAESRRAPEAVDILAALPIWTTRVYADRNLG